MLDSISSCFRQRGCNHVTDDCNGKHVGVWMTREKWTEMYEAGIRAADHPTFEELEERGLA